MAVREAGQRRSEQRDAGPPTGKGAEDARAELPKRDSDGDGFLGDCRRLLAEVLGTFALTMTAAGGEVIARISGGEVSTAAKVVAPGLTVMALIYAIGNVSGAHFNPGVTLAFALRGVFRWSRVPAYWLAEFAGALLAALLLKQMFGTVAHVGASEPHHGTSSAVVMEIFLTWLLITVILGTATRHHLVGADAALAVGGTIALAGLFSAPVSGASMNTARSLGPAFVAGDLSNAWIYVVGPLSGAVLAVCTTWLLHGTEKSGEDEAAGGDGEKQARSHDGTS